MRIEFKKNFVKKHKKLPNKIQNKVYERLKIFGENPIDKRLGNHKLKGSLKGLSAISITGDYRATFYIKGNTAFFVDVGTHNQVYLKSKNEKRFF